MRLSIFTRGVSIAKPVLASPLLLLALSSGIPNEAHARWAGRDDAQAVLEDETLDYEVQADGTYTLVTSRRYRITRDEARSRLGTQRLTYNSRSSRLEVLDARTILPDGRRLEVAHEQIQDKPLASARSGFDQLNQVLVAFPETEVGAVLELRTKLTVTEIPFENYFSASWSPAVAEWTEKSRIRIHSALPLVFTEQDPENILKVSLSSDGHGIEASLRHPRWMRTVEEAESWIAPEQFPLVDIATTRDAARMVRSASPVWERIGSSPIPLRWKSILDAARRETSLEDRIDTLTSKLADEIHYWADWRPIRGGHIPRELEAIAETRFGDCKDFAVSTVALARALGLEAHPAFIERGVRPLRNELKFPVTGAFNHAIAWIRDPVSGRTLFIDPTNRASFARGIFEDIADRPALVLLPDGARLERTPNLPAEASTLRARIAVDATSDDKVRSEVTYELSGRGAAGLTGEELERSRANIEYDVARSFANESRLESWKFKPFALKSRKVADLRLDYTTIEEGPDLRTSAGPAYTLFQGSIVRRLLTSVRDRAGSLWLGRPQLQDRNLELLHAELVGGGSAAELQCELKSPWAEVSRSLSTADEGRIRVSDRVLVLRPWIGADELKSRSFDEFARQLRHCFDRVALVIRRPTEKH